MCHLKGKSEFRASKGSASQASAAAGSASRRETVHMKPFQGTSRPESTYDPADMSQMDIHTATIQHDFELCRFRLPISFCGIQEG